MSQSDFLWIFRFHLTDYQTQTSLGHSPTPDRLTTTGAARSCSWTIYERFSFFPLSPVLISCDCVYFTTHKKYIKSGSVSYPACSWLVYLSGVWYKFGFQFSIPPMHLFIIIYILPNWIAYRSRDVIFAFSIQFTFITRIPNTFTWLHLLEFAFIILLNMWILIC